MPPYQQNIHPVSGIKVKMEQGMKDIPLQKNDREIENVDQGPQGILNPNDTDVLCGRGGNVNLHPGNGTFRRLVESKKRLYLTARFKREKRLIAETILKDIKSQDPPGRFLLKKDGDLWYEIAEDKARDKTSQALREGAPKLRKEMETEKREELHSQMKGPIDEYHAEDDVRYNNRHHSGERGAFDSGHFRVNYNNIMETMSSFGCPGNLGDVRDDERMHTEHYPMREDRYRENEHSPRREEHYPREYPPQRDDRHYENGYNSSHEDRHYENAYPPQREGRHYENDRRYGGWNQSEYNDRPSYNESQHYDSYQGRSHQDSYRHQQIPQVSNVYQYHKRQEMSDSSLGNFGQNKRIRTTSPTAMDMDMDNKDTHMGSVQPIVDVRTPPPEDEDQQESGWASSFCNMHDSLTSMLPWTICGENPNNIKQVHSIEIDEPVSPSDLRGSSLVNVFNDSAMSLVEPVPVIEPVPVQSLNQEKQASMLSLNDSAFNLLEVPSMDINFSTEG